MVLQVVLIFLSFGPYFTVGQSYQTYPNCVPQCSLASYLHPPISGGPPCTCRMDAFPSGCQVPPCGPGDTCDGGVGTFCCACTLYNVPEFCVTLRCDNGTNSYASIYSSCPAYSVLPGSYPSSNYPTPGYSSSNYQSSSYPNLNYPSSNYPSSNYPASPTCSNYCYCQGDQPEDCTNDDDGPFEGERICTCTLDNWPRGCVLPQCKAGDDKWCECSPEFNGSHCFGPKCTVS